MSDIAFVTDNIIGVYSTGVELDLAKTSQCISKSVYNPHRFAAIIVKSIAPKSICLLFKSGKIVISGCKTETELKKSVLLMVKVLKHIGLSSINYRDEEVKIRSMSGHFVFPYKISLEKFYFSHIAESTYEPELFPGLIYRLLNPAIVYTIYVSGKVLINGVKSKAEINKAIDVIYGELVNYRKINLIEK